MAAELQQICQADGCLAARVDGCTMDKADDHSTGCEYEEGGRLIRFSSPNERDHVRMTLWVSETFMEALDEAIGEPMGTSGRKEYRDIPLPGWSLVYHPIAGVIDVGATEYTPWHALLPTIKDALSRGEADRRGRVFIGPPWTLAYLYSGFAVHRAHERGGGVGTTCIEYTDSIERETIAAAIRSGVEGEPKAERFFVSPSFEGVSGFRFPDGTVVVDYEFDWEAESLADPDYPRAIGCWVVGFGGLSEEELLESVPDNL